MNRVHPSMALIRSSGVGSLQRVSTLGTMRAAHRHLSWLVVATLALGGCAAAPGAADPSAPPSSVPAPSRSSNSAVSGAYLDFATCDPNTLHQRTATTQVYFFYKDDCPECRAADTALRNRGVPDGFTVFKVDLPTMSELADRFDVTTPGTFVQVDKSGKKVRSWTGSTDGADIAVRAGS